MTHWVTPSGDPALDAGNAAALAQVAENSGEGFPSELVVAAAMDLYFERYGVQGWRPIANGHWVKPSDGPIV